MFTSTLFALNGCLLFTFAHASFLRIALARHCFRPLAFVSKRVVSARHGHDWEKQAAHLPRWGDQALERARRSWAPKAKPWRPILQISVWAEIVGSSTTVPCTHTTFCETMVWEVAPRSFRYSLCRRSAKTIIWKIVSVFQIMCLRRS